MGHFYLTPYFSNPRDPTRKWWLHCERVKALIIFEIQFELHAVYSSFFIFQWYYLLMLGAAGCASILLFILFCASGGVHISLFSFYNEESQQLGVKRASVFSAFGLNVTQSGHRKQGIIWFGHADHCPPATYTTTLQEKPVQYKCDILPRLNSALPQ